MGKVVGLFICSAAGQPMVAGILARALAGSGFAGDRYATKQGTFSRSQIMRHVSLIDREAIEEANCDLVGHGSTPFGMRQPSTPRPRHCGSSPHRHRPRRRTPEPRNELSAPHSINSSAVASSVLGTVRPRILAVRWLMQSSYFVGFWTGRSAASLRVKDRSTYPAARRN